MQNPKLLHVHFKTGAKKYYFTLNFWHVHLELSLNSHYQRLPEPPEMRGNLKKEIQLFVTALKQRSVQNGR